MLDKTTGEFTSTHDSYILVVGTGSEAEPVVCADVNGRLVTHAPHSVQPDRGGGSTKACRRHHGGVIT
jgi:hypothetical protein